MAAGDLKRRQAEREAMREARRGQGINNADISGSRIPNAMDRRAAEQQRIAAQKHADAIRAGYTPEKPARRANTNNPNPDMSPAEAARRRTEMYENDRRSRAGQPLIGSGITSSNLDGDPTRVGPKPSPATAPDFVNKPDADGNGVPDSIQAGGPAAQPKPAAAAKPAEPRVSMINGRPAHEVLAEMRGEATKRAEGIKDPNQREAAMPFGPTLQERQTEQAWNAKQALANARNKPTSPAAPPATSAPASGSAKAPEPPPFVGPPRPNDGKTTGPVSPAEPPKAPTNATTTTTPTGAEPGGPNPLALANTVMGGIRGARYGAGVRVANLQQDLNTAKAVFNNARSMATQGVNMLQRGREVTNKVTGLANEGAALQGSFNNWFQGKLGMANARAEQGLKTVIEPEVFARKGALDGAARVQKANAEIAQRTLASTEKAAANLIANESAAAKGVVAAAKKTKSPVNRVLSAIAPAAKETSKGIVRRGAGVLMRKLGPILDAVDVASSVQDELTGNKRRDARALELVDKMEKGENISGTAGSAYRMLPATYYGGGNSTTEARALNQARHILDDRAQNAEGAASAQGYQDYRLAEMNRLRKEMVPDAEFDKLTVEQKRGVMRAAAMKRDALRDARNYSRR